MKKLRIIRIIIKWCLSIFCFLCGIATISTLNFGFILFLFLTIAELPIKPVDELWKKIIHHPVIRVVKRIVLSILFLAAVYFAQADPGVKEESNQEVLVEETRGDSEARIKEDSQERKTEQSNEEELSSGEGAGQSEETAAGEGAGQSEETAAGEGAGQSEETAGDETARQSEEAAGDETAGQSEEAAGDETAGQSENVPQQSGTAAEMQIITLQDIPAYAGNPYTIINGNQPFFSENELVTEPFESYSELDDLGRCAAAYANICVELMPTEERGAIGMIKPSGWQTVKYDFVDGKYLYNRCHLIGFQLAGENANTKNLITGTRYFNTVAMLPFENQVAAYVEKTDNHVLYRVTPIYEDKNLVANGVLMEAKSVEDKGEGICFNVFCYNVQPGVIINYADGTSKEDGSAVFLESTKPAAKSSDSPAVSPTETAVSRPTAAPTETAVSRPTAAPTETAVSRPTAAPTETAVSQSAAASAETAISQSVAVPTETASDAGTPTQSSALPAANPAEQPAETPVSISYVLNTNTKKFHRPDCGSVSTIKEKNRKDVNWSKEECEAAGYAGCKKCNP